MKRFLIIVLTSLSLTLTLAEIRYVSKTGGSKPPYTTWETASDSIQKCINLCFNGDTVIVANGVYKEFLVIDSSITLLGSSMDSCIIDGTGLNSRTISTNGFLRITGFHLKGNMAVYGNTIIFSQNRFFEISSCRLSGAGKGLSVLDCSIKDAIISNVLIGVQTFCWSDDWTPRMENSVIIINNDGHNGWIDAADGSPVLIGNIIISLGGVRPSGIDNFGWDKKLTIMNNLVAGFNVNIYASAESTIIINNISRDYSLGLGSTPAASIFNVSNNDILLNNIIISNEIGVDFISQPAKADYNIYYDNVTDITNSIGIGGHDQFADPMFVKDTLAKSLAYDYHLQKYSPGINAGDPEILDVDGTRSDIGMFGGPFGIAYTYNDLPPRPPRDFIVDLDSVSSLLNLKWRAYSEADFSHYNIYRSEIEGFSPDSTNKIAETDTSLFRDSLTEINQAYYYRVVSVDSGGNQSVLGPEIAVVISDNRDTEIRIVDEYQLYQNFPNPFNPTTVIPYSLEGRARVRITVYDIKGELLKELLNKEEEKGYHEVEFNAGEMNLASGIYLYRIEVTGEGQIPKFMNMRKMVLIK